MVGYPGRESQWDFVVGDTEFRVVRGENGPQWQEQSVPTVTQADANTSEETQAMRDWSGGAFYGDRQAGNVYHYTENMQAHVPGMVMMGPEVVVTACSGTGVGPVAGFFEIGGKFWVVAGTRIFEISSSDTVATPTPPTIFATALAVAATDTQLFDSLAVIAVGDTNAYYTFNGTTLTASPGGHKATKLCKFYPETFYALARSRLDDNSKYSVSWMSEGQNHTDLNWVSDYPLGDKTSDITGLVGREQTVFGAKTDGLFYIDGTGRTPQVIDVATIDADNGKGLSIDTSGNIWYPSMDGFFRYNPGNGAIDDLTPWRNKPNRSPIYGKMLARIQYRGWHYAIAYNGTYSYVLMGKESDAGMTWHGAIADFEAGKKACAIAINSLSGSPRMYIGFTDGTYAHWRLQSYGDNPLLDASYRYASTGYQYDDSPLIVTNKVGRLYVGNDNFGVENMYWQLSGLDAEFQGMDDGAYAEVFLSLDDNVWQFVGRIDSSGQKFLKLPTGQNWYCTRYKFRVDVYNPIPTATPIIRSISPRGIRRARMRPVITTAAFCSDRVLSRLGIQTRMAGSEMVDRLQYLETSPPVTLIDWWTGMKREREVLVLPIKYTLVAQKEHDSADAVANLTMIVLNSDIAPYEPPGIATWLWGQDNATAEPTCVYYNDDDSDVSDDNLTTWG